MKNWDELDNRQRRKVVLWFEEHLGELFGEENGYGLFSDKPPVPEGKRLSTKRVYSEKSLGFCPNIMLRGFYDALTLPSVIRYEIPCYERIETRQPVIYSMSPHSICHSQEIADKLSKAHFDMWQLVYKKDGIDKAKALEMAREEIDKKWEDRNYEYVIVRRENGEYKLEEIGMTTVEDALGVAHGLASKLLPRCMRNSKYYKMLDDWDFTKHGVIEIPKREYVEWHLISWHLCGVEKASYCDKVINNAQNDEFIEFANSL